MKKFFLMVVAAMMATMSVNAQEKGDFAGGIHGGPTFTHFEFLCYKENVTRFSFGIFGQYNLSNHWRMELAADYSPKKNDVKFWQAGLDFHYIINVSDNFKIYPLAGFAIQYIPGYTTVDDTKNSHIETTVDSGTDFGVEFGLGLQYNLGSNYFISGEYKYQPGLFGDNHNIMLGVGYRF
jgi:opacity protein-like surface antigen